MELRNRVHQIEKLRKKMKVNEVLFYKELEKLKEVQKHLKLINKTLYNNYYNNDFKE